ncbi:hypothetical protein CCR85_09990 [Rhodothalassium salexigens]|uniref:trypsin-like serine protease n=1 Tax=Rhodothalassium salexigens TaxID=1086 RepID=UPI0019141433|nr:trypsin-like serine protease [Rhodothalassium salexigens]MBK5911817.1 hypothetical protein [Rhodothalassium salexigens]
MLTKLLKVGLLASTAAICATAAASATTISAPLAVDANKVRPRIVTQGTTTLTGATSVNPEDLRVSPSDYSGVAGLFLFNRNPDGSFVRDENGFIPGAGCTGSRIGARKLLTAGHCVAGSSNTDIQFNSALATFLVEDPVTGTATIEQHFIDGISPWQVHPNFTGNLLEGNDVAVLNLTTTPSSLVDTYDIFRGSDDRGSEFEIVGSGTTGTGDTGGTIGQSALTPDLRAGRNYFDDFFFDFGIGDPDTVLWFDFDDGTPERDAFGATDQLFQVFGFPPLGLEQLGVGPDEVNTAPGDSGGPSFINGMIAGITSFGITSDGITLGGIPIGADGDGVTNSSFGEFSGNARVSALQGYIDRALIPAPATNALLAFGLFGAAFAARRKMRRD